ncbi:hypothetical protein PTKIN_Ptkin08bG0130300 [Pterospermum kingtungense]
MFSDLEMLNNRLGNCVRLGQRSESKWTAPKAHWVKINCDAAFKDEGLQADNVGIRMIIKDDSGKFLAEFVDSYVASSSIVAEAMAVKEGILLAKEMGYQNIILETDSKSDIVKLKDSFAGFRCSWVNKKANKVAGWLARLIKKGMSCVGRVLVPPSSLVHILDKDGLPVPPL